jgi:AraC-like DNA-binding protein
VSRRPELGGIDLLRARYLSSTSWPHSHSDLEIGVVTSGSRAVTVDRTSRVAPAGSILVFNPGDVHHGAPVDPPGSGYRAFRFPLTALRSLIDPAEESGPWFPEPVIADRPLARRLVRIHAALESSQAPKAPLLADLVPALGDLARRHAARRPESGAGAGPVPGVERVREFLAQHYAARIRLDALADLAGLGVFRLIRLFRARTGLSPYAYLEQIRIDRATLMLRAGLPVSHVVYRTGFSDQSHLTRFFKRVMGIPPGSYRRTVLATGRARS